MKVCEAYARVRAVVIDNMPPLPRQSKARGGNNGASILAGMAHVRRAYRKHGGTSCW